jgi:hypothetical protein
MAESCSFRGDDAQRAGAADAARLQRHEPLTKVIRMVQRPLADNRTPERSCLYEAEGEVDGRRYSARSRHGAPNELARALVLAGVSDRPVEVCQAGVKGGLTYRSLHEFTCEESATVPLRQARWRPPPDFGVEVRGRNAQNRGASSATAAEEPELPVVGFERFV